MDSKSTIQSSNHSRLWSFLIRIILPGVFFYFLLRKLQNKIDLAELLNSLTIMQIEWKGGFLLMAFNLVFLNWGLEAKKWQLALDQFISIDLMRSFKAILVGVSAGLITPAKLGEYAGRIVLLDNKDRGGGAIATFLCSLGQQTVTIFIGLLALLFLVHEFQLVELKFNVLMIAAAVSVVFIISAFLLLPELINRLSRIKYLREQLVKYKDLRFSKAVLIKILQLSSLRYLVYMVQYLFIFYFLGVECSCVILLGHIALVFFMQSLLPLPPFVALIGRGGIALLVFTNLGFHEIVILTATLLLWVINLILPALCGMIIVSKHGNKVFN